jgi:RimJ/RimL family protein N-acetyltransferase
VFYGRASHFRSEARKVFLGFGATDPSNLTCFALDALAGLDIDLDVVVGAGYPHWNELRSRFGATVSLHRGLPQDAPADLMSTCDAAISAGGTMSLELMVVGVPTAVFAFAENHVRPCEEFEAQGLAIYGGVIPTPDPAVFRSIVAAFLQDDDKRRSLHRAAAERFAESGLSRIANKISQLAHDRRGSVGSAGPFRLELASFGACHLDKTLQWINEPRITEPFLFSREVTEQSHADWFTQLQGDPSQCLFAVVFDGTHIGNLGFKSVDRSQRTAEFWIYLDPAVHGQGLGTQAVRAAISLALEKLRLSRLYLYVSRDNHAARRIYEKAGFRVSAAAARSRMFNGSTVVLDRMDHGDAAVDSELALRSPRVALMQPMFLPWLGYFELMDAVDIFVFLDDFQFTRQSWAQRNRLFLSPGRAGLVTLPIRHPGNLAATFLEVYPDRDLRWYEKLGRSLSQAYGKSPFFAATWSAIGPLLQATSQNLANFEIGIILKMAEMFGIRTQLRRSSEFCIPGLERSERLVALLDAVGAGSYYAARGSADYMSEDRVFPLRRMPVFFQNFEPAAYQQRGAPEFIPRLSALDALFNVSPDRARDLLYGTRQWLDWSEAASSSIGQDPQHHSLEGAHTLEIN